MGYTVLEARPHISAISMYFFFFFCITRTDQAEASWACLSVIFINQFIAHKVY